MRIEVTVTSTEIPAAIPGPAEPRVGAWVEFRGLVRDQENGATILGLEYEAYSPMAENKARQILEELTVENPCNTAIVIHRVGIVPVGEAAIYVGVAAKHRAEALRLLAGFMDRLKQDVPIWKTRAIPSSEAQEIRPANTLNKHPSAEEVRTLISGLCLPLPAERVKLDTAQGRVLREPVLAQEDLPAFDRSSVDGYLIRRNDSCDRFAVVDEIRAGDWSSRTLVSGEAMRISTGGAVPSRDLAVVMKEDVRVENGSIQLLSRERLDNVRFRGEDAKAGKELIRSGTVLTAGASALLASVGVVEPLITRLPRVVHLATGNELVAPDQVPAAGQIRDSNSTLVRQFLAQWSIVPEQKRVREEESHLREALAGMPTETDLLLISGGASVGEHDFTRRLLEEAGFRIQVSRTNARPGKPLIVANRGHTLAFGLPGNPLAHFVCLNIYVRAALERWSGALEHTKFLIGTLAAPLSAPGPHETFWPARSASAHGIITISPLRWSSSGDLTSLAEADCILYLPTNSAPLPAGAAVQFLSTAICR
jgi:molybdopterin molybdotransferase